MIPVWNFLGIELSCRYLDTQMTGLGGDGNTYFLGTVQENGQYLPDGCIRRSLYHSFDGQQTLTGQDTEYMGIRAFESRKSPGTDLYGSVRALSLYDSGSAFADGQWVLIGMQGEGHPVRFTHRIQGMLYTSTAISLVAGILGALWIHTHGRKTAEITGGGAAGQRSCEASPPAQNSCPGN